MRILLFVVLVITSTTLASAQVTFSNLNDYCYAASEASTTTLLVRTQGAPRETAESYMAGMTDPVAIRMVKEVIAFAYSRPATTKLDDLRAELKALCLAKKIFVQ